MATIATKFSIDDKVWCARIRTEKRQHPCPDCLGAKEWAVTSPAGTAYAFRCPRCSARYAANHDSSLDYNVYIPHADNLTIGSVRIDTSDRERPVSYMCRETGVGSGSVYDECKLFPTQEEAIAFAQTEADEANAKTKWVVDQYKDSLEVSDYQLTAAKEFAAERAAKRKLEKLEDVFDELQEAEDMETVRRILGNEREAA
jgi:hypothetical protein